MAEVMHKKGLEGVVVADTRLSRVQGDVGQLTYCGYSIEDLAEHASFEEVVFLLWYNALPTKTQLARFRHTLIEHMTLPAVELDAMTRFPVNAHPMAVVRSAVSALGLYDAAAEDNSQDANYRKAIHLTAKLPTIVAAWARIRVGKDPVAPRSNLGLATNFLYMLTGEEPDPVEVDAFIVYLVLLADHGMNASTFTSRVVTSTDGDMYSAITAAIGSLKGPKHGGANEAAMRMFREVMNSKDAEGWFKREIKGKGRRIMGIGHRVYKVPDPRAVILREHAIKLCTLKEKCGLLDAALHLEELALADEFFIERKLYPNVDYFSAIVLDAIGIESDMMTPLFAMARVAGWTAHVIEQWTDNRLIRPRGNYIGASGLKWTPMEERVD
jgi:citrate synthase